MALNRGRTSLTDGCGPSRSMMKRPMKTELNRDFQYLCEARGGEGGVILVSLKTDSDAVMVLQKTSFSLNL